jgi:hypothetical protein
MNLPHEPTSCQFCHTHRIRFYPTTKLGHCPDCGITWVHQPVTTAVYDEQYVAERYDRYPTTERMSRLRLDLLDHVLFVQEALPERKPRAELGRLLDVGYGNGSFIHGALRYGWDAYGNDVNPTEYPGVRRVGLPTQERTPGPRYRVITFFDALEHFESLDEVRRVVYNTDWIVVSVPVPPPGFLGHPETWKHWRPGEHHWYFHHPFSLEHVFRQPGREARVRYIGHPEDVIRQKLPDGQDNVMTVFLQCRDTIARR